jgi:hypothetical protein
MGLSSGTEDMAEDTALSELLSQLDGIANAPLTGSQREARAKPVVEAGGLKVDERARSFGRLDLVGIEKRPRSMTFRSRHGCMQYEQSGCPPPGQSAICSIGCTRRRWRCACCAQGIRRQRARRGICRGAMMSPIQLRRHLRGRGEPRGTRRGPRVTSMFSPLLITRPVEYKLTVA